MSGETFDMAALAALIVAALRAATPLALAALGELVAERSGVLNLGVEGMMLMGAVGAFAAVAATGSPLIGLLAAVLLGMLTALLFGWLTLYLLTNQVATGLALTIFGVGLSAFIGQEYVGRTITPLPALDLGRLSEIPLAGPIVFAQDPLVYAAVALSGGVWWFLCRTRTGLALRAIGENPHAAHALGYPVRRVRLGAVLFGGASSGLAGAYLSIVYTPMWGEGMSGGRGWIALALVVFATWRPWRALFGAFLFGALSVLQMYVQGQGGTIPPQFLSMLPYLATIAVLVLISRNGTRLRLNAPASLGKGFRPET